MKTSQSDAIRLEIQSNSPGETEALGERLGRLLKPGDTVCLSGNLGAGKTCLARGIARGWGAVETASSPTFALINEYHRQDGSRLFHVDGYRLSSVDDALSTGIEDAIEASQVMVIEWPDRLAGLLPNDSLFIQLTTTGESTRRLNFSAAGDRSQRLVDALAEPNS